MHSDLINAIQTLILETPTILASPEDAHYFRSSLKSPNKPTPQVVIKAPEPPKTEPVIVDSNNLQNRNFEEKPTPPKTDSSDCLRIEPPPAMKVIEPPKPQPVIAEPILKIPQLQPLPVPDAKPTNASFRSLFQKLAPNIAILQEIPSDALAKKIATRWKTKNQIAPISILSFHEPSKQKALLLEISKAIDVYFGPAKLIEADAIEKEKQWDTFLQPQQLKCIIACDYTLWQLSGLMQFYQETAATQERTLQGIPVFLLPDLSLYLKDPQLKRSLWKGLCNKLSS